MYYEWPATALAEHDRLEPDEVLIRLVTSFDTRPEEITQFVETASGN